MEKKFKKYINSVHPYQPGKPIREVQRELGLSHVVKMASNENPLGPSPKAVDAMKEALSEAHFYPEGSCFYLAKTLSEKLGLPTEQLIFGNGSNEIIELLMRGFVSEGDEVLSSATTFLVYPILTQVCGARYVEVPMKDFRYDLAAMAGAITDKTKLVFIANPNNPTGTIVKRKEVEAFLAKVPDHVLVCFDEAYVDFVQDPDFLDGLSLIKEGKPNVVVLRTFSKSFGLAGLRVGYGAASKEIVGYLHKIRQPFNVNAIAQVGAEAALRDDAFVEKTQKLVFEGREFFYDQFKRLGLRYLPSEANFVLVDLEKEGENICRDLLKRGIIVRSMAAYGLPEWIRVTFGLPEQNTEFFEVLSEILKS